MSKTVLILGASYAGLTVAHKLLKSTLPAVPDLKIVLVSPTTHLYWNMASVRAIIPGQFGDDKMFAEIAPGFSKYPSESFEFVLGTATSMDTSAKTVTIKTISGPELLQTYETLVITTGSHTIGEVPWKGAPSGYEQTKELLHKYREKVASAKSIVVGGAGPTGVETVGELGFEYGKTKNIILITSSDEILKGAVTSPIASSAQKELEKLNVDVRLRTRINSAKLLSTGQTELSLSCSEKLLCDLYLPSVGTIPNSDFIPKELLDGQNFVKVDQYLRVHGNEDIWAAGDIIDAQPSQYVYADKQALALAKNLDLVLRSKNPTVYKTDGAPILAVALGRSKATGRSGNFKLPSLIVWFVKGRTLGTQNLLPYVNGTKF
ncbi:a96dc603-00c9-4110-af78-ed83ddb7a5db [Sclerotinia trifoliorum]|uniref:A96dc603-00c9-4110-af78-ed83ddb7a5db n=1 Tax=Sclerotinia trifoliorum TaxID=28548 RepID=A0A8H2ZSG9_9HELO|nr:a96dc603-00c9-4110-af78-ed83ddb7a5db [Sclerotinia trifoliorum]